MSGACRRPPLLEAASTVIALGAPVAQRFVPSSGSTAMSTSRSSARPRPTFSPMKSIGASSRSPSPMTTVPRMAIASISLRIDSVATWSECRRSPCPMVRAQATAATSHTRRKSRDSRSTFTAMASPRAPPGSLRLAGVDVHHLAQEVERLAARPLEGVVADDRPEAAAVADGAHLLEDGGGILRLAAREDDDPPPVEGALHDVAHPLGEGRDRDALLLVDLLRRRLLDVRRRRLHLDDVRAQLAGDLRRVGDHVDCRLALLGDARAARVGPDDHGEALALGLVGQLADLAVHLVARRRGGIDGEADRAAPEAEGIVGAAGDRRAWVAAAGEAVGVVELQDERDLARELRRPGLEEAERRRVGVAARRQRQLEVVAWIVRNRIGRKGTRRAVLEALVDGQDHEPAAARQAPVVHEARQVGQRARVVASVPAQDLSYALVHGRKLSSEMDWVIAGSGSCRGRS